MQVGLRHPDQDVAMRVGFVILWLSIHHGCLVLPTVPANNVGGKSRSQLQRRDGPSDLI